MLLLRSVLVLSLLLTSAVAIAGCGGDDDTPAKASKDTPGIVLGTEIAGVAIGDEVDAVVALLGEPERREEFANEISGATDETLEWKDPAVEVIVAPVQPIVDPASAKLEAVQVSTTDDSLRSLEGVGVGSSRADVVEAYPKAACDSGEIVICRVPGSDNLTTDFFVEDDSVTRVVVGRILD